MEEKRKKQALIYKAMRKNLKLAEKSSLISSINKCTEWGDDAEKYIISTKICPSLFYQYALALRNIGVPVRHFRESLRYRFMLFLSLQQTWKGNLGEIMKNTKFIDCHKIEVKENSNANPFEVAVSMLKNNEDYEKVAAVLKEGCTEKILWCSFYVNNGNILICTYVKPKQIYQYSCLYGNFSRTINFSNPLLSKHVDEEIKDGTLVNCPLYNPFDDMTQNYDEWFDHICE